MAKKRGLGRGLDALLGGAQGTVGESTESTVSGTQALIALDLIQRGRFQPRRHFDEDKLRELADSITAQGVVQPIVVRPATANEYELVAGERRWRAAQLAGLAEIPAVIRDVDDKSAMVMGLIENIQRDDLNPLEEAEALHRLLEEFDLTHQQIAQAVGKSRTTVTNLIRLLELNPDVKAYVDLRQLEMGHARALMALQGDEQSAAAALVVKKGMSVRDTEALVRKRKQAATQVDKPAAAGMVEDDPDVRRMLQGLTETLGAQVQLKQSAGGKGKLTISYNSLDELEGIMAHIH
jgi:ParB family chromosome partitioning protein